MLGHAVIQNADLNTKKENILYDRDEAFSGNASVKLKNRRTAMSYLWEYVVAAICVAVFGAIYESFSFGVYSYYMIYAFLSPLVLGVLPWLMIATSSKAMEKQDFPPRMTINLWSAGVTTLTVGSIFMGILDIYGTTSVYTRCYFIVGGMLLLIALMTLVGYKEKQTTSTRIS